MTSRKKHSPRSAKPALTCEELIRYGRQIAMPQFGRKGQERLHRARVAIVGMGGLGSPAAIYLATAGIGTLGLVDCDRVALSNLHRQVVHPDANVGRAKTESAAAVLSALNPRVTIRQHPERLSPENAAEASYIDGVRVVPAANLRSLVAMLKGGVPLEVFPPRGWDNARVAYSSDFSDIKGQQGAKRAAEIAVAGGQTTQSQGGASAWTSPPGSAAPASFAALASACAAPAAAAGARFGRRCPPSL